ncbi:ImmA/IrrE family metallo-endopeptidase [Salinimicrobium sp. CAU 1759]
MMVKILSDHRKEELSDLAEVVVEPFLAQVQIDPEKIALSNKISFSYGHYRNSFDGLIQHRSGRFHIFINNNRVGTKENPRSRFTFAHELGHYYIDEHRNALKRGKVPSHPSFNRLVSENLAEREADFFASCLLMPERRFRSKCFRKPLSGRLIEDLSKSFGTSLSATIFRYFHLDLYPMFIVFAKNGIIKWYFRSPDFKYKFPPKYNSKVPETSVAGEFFYLTKKYIQEETIFSDDWFSDHSMDPNDQLYEKCYYLKDTNSTISVIWMKE